MEDIEKLPPGQLDELYRSRYRDHIDEHFPKLFKLIERRTASRTRTIRHAGDMPPGPRHGLGRRSRCNPRRTTGIVDWVDADQKIKTFRDRFPAASPTTLDIMMAQEDLWIYETLLKVIRNTNDIGPDPKHDPNKYKKPANHKVARIKQILAMDIGKDAVDSWSQVREGPLQSAQRCAGGNAAPADAGPPAVPTACTGGRHRQTFGQFPAGGPLRR